MRPSEGKQSSCFWGGNFKGLSRFLVEKGLQGRPSVSRLGVTSMCLGSGMGAASVIELEWAMTCGLGSSCALGLGHEGTTMDAVDALCSFALALFQTAWKEAVSFWLGPKGVTLSPNLDKSQKASSGKDQQNHSFITTVEQASLTGTCIYAPAPSTPPMVMVPPCGVVWGGLGLVVVVCRSSSRISSSCSSSSTSSTWYYLVTGSSSYPSPLWCGVVWV